MGHCDADMMATFSEDEVKLVAMTDINPAQMEDAPEGVIRCNNAEELLVIDEINVVMIFTPTPSHLETVEKYACTDNAIRFET